MAYNDDDVREFGEEAEVASGAGIGGVFSESEDEDEKPEGEGAGGTEEKEEYE